MGRKGRAKAKIVDPQDCLRVLSRAISYHSDYKIEYPKLKQQCRGKKKIHDPYISLFSKINDAINDFEKDTKQSDYEQVRAIYLVLGDLVSKGNINSRTALIAAFKERVRCGEISVLSYGGQFSYNVACESDIAAVAEEFATRFLSESKPRGKYDEGNREYIAERVARGLGAVLGIKLNIGKRSLQTIIGASLPNNFLVRRNRFSSDSLQSLLMNQGLDPQKVQSLCGSIDRNIEKIPECELTKLSVYVDYDKNRPSFNFCMVNYAYKVMVEVSNEELDELPLSISLDELAAGVLSGSGGNHVAKNAVKRRRKPVVKAVRKLTENGVKTNKASIEIEV